MRKCYLCSKCFTEDIVRDCSTCSPKSSFNGPCEGPGKCGRLEGITQNCDCDLKSQPVDYDQHVGNYFHEFGYYFESPRCLTDSCDGCLHPTKKYCVLCKERSTPLDYDGKNYVYYEYNNHWQKMQRCKVCNEYTSGVYCSERCEKDFKKPHDYDGFNYKWKLREWEKLNQCKICSSFTDKDFYCSTRCNLMDNKPDGYKEGEFDIVQGRWAKKDVCMLCLNRIVGFGMCDACFLLKNPRHPCTTCNKTDVIFLRGSSECCSCLKRKKQGNTTPTQTHIKKNNKGTKRKRKLPNKTKKISTK